MFGRSNRRRETTPLLGMTMLLTTLIFVGCTRNQDAPKLLTSTASWPLPVQDLFAELVNLTPSTKMDGYLLSGKPGPHSITSAVFRVHNVDAEMLTQLKTALDLTPIDPQHRIAAWGQSVVKHSSTEWWPTAAQENVELFACQPWLDGEEGDLYTVAHEPSTNTTYICYYFNF